jgi:DNA-binding transcriptional regulator PaaX
MKKVSSLARRAKTKEITKAILSICAIGGLTILAGGGIRSSKKAEKLISGLAQYSSYRIKECLKRLKMQNYIKYDATDLTKPIYITKNGLERISLLSLKDKIKSLSLKKWDHLWRLVTFDVNENYRSRRDNFRRRLKSLNFYQLQKNIFITPFAIEREIEEIAREYHLQNHVLILHVASLGKHEQTVKNYFLLP